MRYQNMAMSPVARTVRALVEKGLVVRTPNPLDGRSDLIDLTPKGEALLRFDPRNDLEVLLAKMMPDHLASLALALQSVIQGMVNTEAVNDAVDRTESDQ